jgi:outer membrane protein assembly factor BamE (lipoprotein component of BamABCDE complex)
MTWKNRRKTICLGLAVVLLLVMYLALPIPSQAATVFGLGSSSATVRTVMGTPTSVSQTFNYSHWYYGTSSVDFEDGKVTGWQQGSRTLKVSTGTAVSGATPIRVGSTTSQVTAAMGTPTSVSQILNLSTWYYGSSTVDFEDGKVTGWQQGSRTLKVSTGSAVSGATPIRVGSTASQVTAAMGTPQSMASFGFGSSWWYYGLSTVELENGLVTGWANHGDLTGKTTSQNVFKGVEETIPYTSVSQYATALIIPKAQTTAIWRLPRTERVQSTVRLSSGCSFPFVAENGSYYGQISQQTGRSKTVFVHSYYRSDGAYVRSYYRSLPH